MEKQNYTANSNIVGTRLWWIDCHQDTQMAKLTLTKTDHVEDVDEAYIVSSLPPRKQRHQMLQAQWKWTLSIFCPTKKSLLLLEWGDWFERWKTCGTRWISIGAWRWSARHGEGPPLAMVAMDLGLARINPVSNNNIFLLYNLQQAPCVRLEPNFRVLIPYRVETSLMP